MIDKTKDKWWKQLQYQCPKCKQYLCFKLFKEDKDFYYKKCSNCGFEGKRIIYWSEWKMKGNKIFLRSNKQKEYIEVKLKEGFKKGRKYLKIEPKNNINKIGFNNIKLL